MTNIKQVFDIIKAQSERRHTPWNYDTLLLVTTMRVLYDIGPGVPQGPIKDLVKTYCQERNDDEKV